MNGRYRIVEHPADLGIEAEGNSVGDAFAAAAEGLISLIVDTETIDEVRSVGVELSAGDYEQLLVRWLSEVLWLFDGGDFVPKRFLITEISPTGLCATLRGETFRLEKHPTRMDVKAVTYHQVSVTPRTGGAGVRVFLDI